ncbi:MAG: TolC family protein [Gemmatimonadaceae bacterium]
MLSTSSRALLLLLLTPLIPRFVAAQRPISRSDAIESALKHGSRLPLAVADTAIARAGILGARALQNPALSAAYSKSPPELHFIAELPFDLPGIRRARIASATSALGAARLLVTYERAAAALDADTTYTRAQAAEARARLSAHNAIVADTLLMMAVARRDAGDVSDLEVELARVNAGQEHNLAIADSVELSGQLIDLQVAMGILSSELTVKPADTLRLPSKEELPAPLGTPLQLAAGLASVTAAERNLTAERRSIFGSPALMAGVETRDPGGTGNKLLPTFGITLPIPLLNRNRPGIALASAELYRARAALLATQLDYSATVSRMERLRQSAYSRATRDASLLTSANRVAAMSVVAYRAGAFPLSNVLEAQRTARDILRQYVDDVADVWIATAALRVLTLTAGR